MEDLRSCVEALALAVLEVTESLQLVDDNSDSAIKILDPGNLERIRGCLQKVGRILEHDELEQALAETAPDLDPS